MKVKRNWVLAGLFVAVVGGAGLLLEDAIRDRLGMPDDDDAQEKPVVAPSRLIKESGRVRIVLDAEELERAGIATQLAQPMRFERLVTTYAQVVEPSEVIDAVAQVREARARVAAAEAKVNSSTAAWNRSKALYSDGKSLSTAQLQLSEEVYRSDIAARDEAQSRLAALGDSLKQNWGEATAKSILSGQGVAQQVTSGQALLVRVPLPVADAPPLMDLDWDNGGKASAKLVTWLPKVDTRFQQRLALYQLAARGGPPPGITVSAKVAAGKASDGIAVPVSAIVWWQGGAWIYVETEEGKFERFAVADPTPQPDGTVFVAGQTDGLALGGLPVVVVGAQTLLSEESRDRIGVGEEGRSK